MDVEASNSNFVCPITAEIMVDPVIDRDGNTYERTAIEEWLKRHGTSPITRRPLNFSDLTPNRVLKNAIDEARQRLEAAGHTLTPESASIQRVTAAAAPSSSSASSTVGSAIDDAPDVCFSTAYKRTPSTDPATAQYTCMVSVATREVNRSSVPSDIVVVIDTSGSMGNEAKTQSVESSGLSLLDIVKHGVKTIIQTLGPHDRLAVVSFSNYATVVFDLMLMDIRGKISATEQLGRLMPEGMTNIWDGLQVAMDLLKTRAPLPGTRAGSGGRNAAILLLTDGEPNIEPPRGHLPMLRKYRDSNGGNYPGFISTFGFGYSLDSQLLVKIAKECGGMYAFIPDSGFVGTAFINALANILSTVAADCSVSVENIDDSRSGEAIPGALPMSTVTWGSMGVLGSLQLGQSQECILDVKVPLTATTPFVSVVGKFRASGTSRDGALIELPGNDLGLDPVWEAEIDFHLFRAKFVSCVERVIAAFSTDPPGLAVAQDVVRSLLIEMRAWLSAHTDTMTNTMDESDHLLSSYRKIHFLAEDLAGQVTQAVSRVDWYRKWGRHYLPSLSRAHELQQCNNFKDVGIQHYGGKLFRQIRDRADEAFARLPAPVAARPVMSVAALASAQAGRAPPPPPAINMTSFNDRSMPCFHEQCTVTLKSGLIKTLLQLSRGDVLDNGAIVLCKVRTFCPESRADLVEVPGGLLITPWHPMKAGSSWAFPCDLYPVVDMRCNSVYSVVLDRAGSNRHDALVVNGVEVVALGHGISHDHVASHPYLGTDAVVHDLQQCVGWKTGEIVFNAGCLVRNSNQEESLVTGFACKSEIVVA